MSRLCGILRFYPIIFLFDFKVFRQADKLGISDGYHLLSMIFLVLLWRRRHNEIRFQEIISSLTTNDYIGSCDNELLIWLNMLRKIYKKCEATLEDSHFISCPQRVLLFWYINTNAKFYLLIILHLYGRIYLLLEYEFYYYWTLCHMIRYL